MKIYRKILGIISLIIIVVIAGSAIYGLIDDSLYWWEFFIVLFAIYVLLHFLISCRFGFNESAPSRQPFFIMISVVTMLILVAIPTALLIQERAQEIEVNQRTQELKKPLDLGKDTTAFNIESNLKTRLENNYLEYVFTAKYLTNKRPDIQRFLVSLCDSSGFKVDEITIIPTSRNFDSEKNIHLGYTQTGKITFEDIDQYERINSFDVAIIVKN